MELIILAGAAFFLIKGGFVRGVVSTWKKSDAATGVQRLLEQQWFDGNAQQAAVAYVEKAWESKPAIFNGKFGQRPHKLATICYSLAIAANDLDKTESDNTTWVTLALGNALSQAVTNRRLYPFTNMDDLLLEEAIKIFSSVMAKQQETMPLDNDPFAEKSVHNLMAASTNMMEEKKAKIEAKGIPYIHHNLNEGVFQMVDFPYQSYEEWDAAYRNAAIESNPALKLTPATDGKMLSLLDLLDEEPCRRAYSHHLDPIKLGRKFGETFDPLNIGFADGSTTRELVEELKAKGEI